MEIQLSDIPEIDEEHRTIINGLDGLQKQLENSIDSELAKDSVSLLLYQFILDCENHFQNEELLMEESQYSSRAMHAMEHNETLKALKLQENNWQEPLELLGFLREQFIPWLDQHLAISDFVLYQHLNKARA